ncbi:haloacid dehalogenase-like hydrolase family protein [Trichomonas vaginalis G3]|uniref:Haloacid dehalogenase-like hydrolase family protein n=1 Tax=Trichomonas vaginalis (strain ATCC PRA-98 / G3) TaxID=412133 RepID=A2EBK2_TRIV3|nr:pseudouridine 5'-phosphatase protein [Trichomonas vaginalis G3]EAY09919.1 haloacid dehalogenase-like hydrolase family protein [Trichomonas vaginalis G3]KAI5523057.1 pseudouridine 5'-phosphatase protein [Trichomonas vaginalis G3]|eukprot:XP_001322142.1 haloacid dehalogenase-like hydrolase family protein [Trichomonas vaginalis G3]
MTSERPVIKAVIFDSDGTIIDSAAIFWNICYKIAGHEFPTDFYLELNGLKDTDLAARVIKRYNLNMTPEEFLHQKDILMDEEIEHLPLIKGIDQIIYKLHDMGIPISIATGSQRIPFERKYVNQPIIKLFKHIITGEKCKVGKPDPTIFLSAMKMMGDFKPENVLVFEDAYLGVLAAQRAGMHCVYVHNDPSNVEEQFKIFGIKNAVPHEKNWCDFDFNRYIWEPQK